ncbi:BnaA09g01920D [Brassica napus]|uniref:BnaA09g01920D protein n=1 Tax=Brassica napus TaxID=3708 RepID=A0A078G3U5_BRANA|nr:BnaA09g01920D [Brassica napus]
MGSVSLKIGDGTARFRRTSVYSSAVNLLMLFSVVTTNLFALYAFSSHSQSSSHPLHHSNNISLVSQHLSLILREIDSSQRKLAQMEKQILGYESIDLSRPNIVPELKLFLHRHQLPLGKDSRTGITEMVSAVGHSCERSPDLLSQYMSYKVFDRCPDDWSLGQKLILRGCEPLPRRRCLAKTIGSDCVGCLDLGTEKDRFVKVKGKNDFLVDDVLGLANGKIRIGFDVSGGSGTFAARMAERNVTVITNALNNGGPFSEFIAARGVFPLFLSLDHRFPFHDNVFDLVHGSSGLDVEGKPEKMEFLMFDLDRVLKPGGLFWLDNFYCASDVKKKELTRLIERFGYKKLKWVIGEKADGQVNLSAVLQKPVRV